MKIVISKEKKIYKMKNPKKVTSLKLGYPTENEKKIKEKWRILSNVGDYCIITPSKVSRIFCCLYLTCS